MLAKIIPRDTHRAAVARQCRGFDMLY